MYNLSLPNGQSPLYLHESKIVPYAEPETKDEAKEAKGDAKELNLYALLDEHEGETFYSPIYGEAIIQFDKESGLMEVWPISKDAYLPAASNGHHADNPEKGCCIIFPSRALYEQYPLEPQKAWMKWQEEQTQYKLHLMLDAMPECALSSETDSYEFAFRTSTDRDKCIEDIKAIISKYSKQWMHS